AGGCESLRVLLARLVVGAGQHQPAGKGEVDESSEGGVVVAGELGGVEVRCGQRLRRERRSRNTVAADLQFGGGDRRSDRSTHLVEVHQAAWNWLARYASCAFTSGSRFGTRTRPQSADPATPSGESLRRNRRMACSKVAS